MQIKAPLTLALALVLSLVSAQDCRIGGKHIGDSCAKSNPGDLACGDHRVLSYMTHNKSLHLSFNTSNQLLLTVSVLVSS